MVGAAQQEAVGQHLDPEGTRQHGGDPAFVILNRDVLEGGLQFIPQAWRNWHVDGGGDGVEDPQNIDDAALAAANYLCRASTAFDTEDGWRAGIRAYFRRDFHPDEQDHLELARRRLGEVLPQFAS